MVRENVSEGVMVGGVWRTGKDEEWNEARRSLLSLIAFGHRRNLESLNKWKASKRSRSKETVNESLAQKQHRLVLVTAKFIC